MLLLSFPCRLRSSGIFPSGAMRRSLWWRLGDRPDVRTILAPVQLLASFSHRVDEPPSRRAVIQCPFVPLLAGQPSTHALRRRHDHRQGRIGRLVA